MKLRAAIILLKIQLATIPDFRNLSALLATLKVARHTYSLKEEREFRVNLPVQSVRWITNHAREPLDLVLVTSNTTSLDNATKRSFYNIKAICSLTAIKVEQPHKKSIPGQCFNSQLYGHSSKNCFLRVRCVKCLGDHGTAACARNKDSDGPPTCVLCKSSVNTTNYLGCP
ncbi:hypothetical protein EVAR_64591_1 [Eumeta japonica]|uniref:Pre-C2HC domain-containing protein n=1 Tax=Eumeta variegata TaxID=151549 RepID=A0A4C1Z6D3_EUMVA|nr:hypothetical protein EVAR_64591_1 [Eumeta japonica]